MSRKTGQAEVRVGLMEGRRALVAVFLQALTTVCHLRPPSHYFSRCIFAWYLILIHFYFYDLVQIILDLYAETIGHAKSFFFQFPTYLYTRVGKSVFANSIMKTPQTQVLASISWTIRTIMGIPSFKHGSLLYWQVIQKEHKSYFPFICCIRPL